MAKDTIVKILQCMKCGKIYEEPQQHVCPTIRHWNTFIVHNHIKQRYAKP